MKQYQSKENYVKSKTNESEQNKNSQSRIHQKDSPTLQQKNNMPSFKIYTKSKCNKIIRVHPSHHNIIIHETLYFRIQLFLTVSLS